jgi:hypothetical protein
MVKGQGEEENIPEKREKELMNTALAALASLAASRDEDYADDDKNEPKNENEPMDHGVDRPPAAAE